MPAWRHWRCLELAGGLFKSLLAQAFDNRQWFALTIPQKAGVNIITISRQAYRMGREVRIHASFSFRLA